MTLHVVGLRSTPRDRELAQRRYKVTRKDDGGWYVFAVPHNVSNNPAASLGHWNRIKTFMARRNQSADARREFKARDLPRDQ